MKTLKTLLILSMAMIFALAACSPAAEVPDLEGTSWILLEINGQPVIEGSDPTLIFNDDSIGGDGSCNVFGGEYEVENGSISFSNVFSTLMFCEDTSEQEAGYFTALEEAASYQVENGNLQILNADGQVTLTFAPMD